MKKLSQYMDGRIIVAVGDITGFSGDAIVNAANSALAGGGGVDGAIHKAAGTALYEECRALRAGPWPGGLPAGGAAATGAGNLPLKGIIHAVGPIWRGGAAGEAEKLASAYTESLSIARDRGWRSLAFPAIATGVYGYPKELAALVVYKSLLAFLSEYKLPEEVWLVYFSENDANIFIAGIK